MGMKKTTFFLGFLLHVSGVLHAGKPIVAIALFLAEDATHRVVRQEACIRDLFGLAYDDKDMPILDPVLDEMVEAIYQGVDVVVASASLIRTIFDKTLVNRFLHAYIEKKTESKRINANVELIKKVKIILDRIDNDDIELYKTIQAEFGFFVSRAALKRFGGFGLDNMGLRTYALSRVKKRPIGQVFKEKHVLLEIDIFYDIFGDGKDTKIKKVLYLSGHGARIKDSTVKNRKAISETKKESKIAKLKFKEYLEFIEFFNQIGCLFLYVSSCFAGGRNLINLSKFIKSKHIDFVMCTGCLEECPVTLNSASMLDFSCFFKEIKRVFQTEQYRPQAMKPDMFKKALSCLRYSNKNINYLPYIAIPYNQNNQNRGDVGLFKEVNIFGPLVKSIKSGNLPDEIYPVRLQQEMYLLLYAFAISNKIQLDSCRLRCVSVVAGPSSHYIKTMELDSHITPKDFLNLFCYSGIYSQRLFWVEKVLIRNDIISSEKSNNVQLVGSGEHNATREPVDANMREIFSHFVIFKPIGEKMSTQAIYLKKIGDRYKIRAVQFTDKGSRRIGRLKNCKRLLKDWINNTIPQKDACSNATGSFASYVHSFKKLVDRFVHVVDPVSKVEDKQELGKRAWQKRCYLTQERKRRKLIQ